MGTKSSASRAPIQLFGSPVIRGVKAEDLVPLRRRKMWDLMGTLALNTWNPHGASHEAIARGLWGDVPPVTARALVKRYVADWNKALKPLGVWIESNYLSDDGWALGVDCLDVDVLLFHILAGYAHDTITCCEGWEDEALELARDLDEALKLCPGGMPPTLGWLHSESLRQEWDAKLSDLWFQAWEGRVQVYLSQGEAEKARGELTGLVRMYPLRDVFWAQLMVAEYRLRGRHEAAAVRERACAVFRAKGNPRLAGRLTEFFRCIEAGEPYLGDPAQAEGLAG